MLKPIVFFYLILFTGLFLGCKDNYEDLIHPCKTDGLGEEVNSQESSLVGKWKYEGFYKNGSFEPTPDDALPGSDDPPYRFEYFNSGDIFFVAENKFGLESLKEYKSGAIRFQNVLSNTLVSPVYPWWENHMVEALENAKCYELDKNQNKLRISSVIEDGEKISMKFRRIED